MKSLIEVMKCIYITIFGIVVLFAVYVGAEMFSEWYYHLNGH